MSKLEIRKVLSPYVGRTLWFRGRTVVDEPAAHDTYRTLLYDLDVFIYDAWVRVARHCWIHNWQALCDNYGHGTLLRFEAVVTQYTTRDICTGKDIARYGVGRPQTITAHGIGSVDDAVQGLISAFGWDTVADAMERLHTEEPV